MAVTSIWSVRGQLGRVLVYAANPEKSQSQETEPRLDPVLSDVIGYAMQAGKTEGCSPERGVKQQFVSGINCSPATAREEMQAVKRRFGKEGGVMAYHGYQSFAPGEATPASAHEIGVQLARELWGEAYQVLVATHLDQAHHLHNHFVVNTVSFQDGRRYHRSNADYQAMRECSDALCRAYGLSVVEPASFRPGKSYSEWKAEQEGRPTWRGIIRSDVEEALRKARTESQFLSLLRQKGYALKLGADITVRPPGKERGMKLARNFGAAYTREAICRRILTQTKSSRPPLRVPQSRIRHYRVAEKPKRRVGGLKGLYLHYCYQLGILPRGRTVKTAELPFVLKEEVTKLNRITKEIRLLCTRHIETAEQLAAYREELLLEQEALQQKRSLLQKQARAAARREPETAARLRSQAAECSKTLRQCRTELGLCDGISERAGGWKKAQEQLRQQEEQRKEEAKHDRKRRSSRSGSADVYGSR